MFDGKTIGVVVPAFNESRFIGTVIDTMPGLVDRVIVVDDGSTDGTAEIVDDRAKSGTVVAIHHEHNAGLGQSLIDGYQRALELELDVVAVMAGDGQMAPADLERVVRPIVCGDADYVKGNRLLRDEVVARMPRHRLIGNSILTILTKYATGYWHSMDPQCGYTAISRGALERIPIETMRKGYGYNAHILNMLNLADRKIAEVEVEPVYGDEVSYIKLRKYVPSVSALLVRLFVRRIVRKYLVRDFHPLAPMYLFSLMLALVVCPVLFVRFLVLWARFDLVPQTTFLLLAFSSMFAMLSLFFAMWWDMEDNRRLWFYPDRRRSERH